MLPQKRKSLKISFKLPRMHEFPWLAKEIRAFVAMILALHLVHHPFYFLPIPKALLTDTFCPVMTLSLLKVLEAKNKAIKA